MSDTNLPLWELLAQTWDSVPEYMLNLEQAYSATPRVLAIIRTSSLAAQIRVIADKVEADFATHIVGDDPVMNVVEWLRHEADRAEAGG